MTAEQLEARGCTEPDPFIIDVDDWVEWSYDCFTRVVEGSPLIGKSGNDLPKFKFEGLGLNLKLAPNLALAARVYRDPEQ